MHYIEKKTMQNKAVGGNCSDLKTRVLILQPTTGKGFESATWLEYVLFACQTMCLLTNWTGEVYLQPLLNSWALKYPINPNTTCLIPPAATI